VQALGCLPSTKEGSTMSSVCLPLRQFFQKVYFSSEKT